MNDKEPTLEEMKQAVQILFLAASLSPRRIGQGEYVVRCPFGKHEDKTPSCHINQQKNLFHCKGCGEKGSVLDWLMLTEKLDIAGGIRRLKEEYRRNIITGGQSVSLSGEDRLVINLLEPRLQKALRLLVDYYHNNFKNKKEGAAYLMKRGLVYGELVEEYRIGFSDNTINVNDEEIYRALVEPGVFKTDSSGNGSGSFKENFSNRVIFPVYDENGLIVQIYGRNITHAGPKHMLLSAPLALFNPKALISSEIILCESIIDALSIMAMGYRNVVSALSVNGLKDNLLEQIMTSGVRKVFIAFDNDNAGNTSASLLAEKLIEHKIESYRITFDENTDANDLLKRSENIDQAREKVAELIETALPLKQLTDMVNESGSPSTSISGAVEKKGKEYIYKIGQREYVIRGLDQNKTDSALKVFLRLNHDERFHIDNNLDLFNAKATGLFCRAAGSKLNIDYGVISSDLDSLTIKLDELLKKTLEEKENKTTEKKKEYHKNLETSFKAREFLTDPLFIVKFVKDMERAGVVGERLNMFFGFLSTLSRYMKYPLHLIIQSESSAGKSNMLNLLSKLVPEESMIYLTQVTPRSFYYGEPDFLKNKSIFIAEADGLKEAEFPIKQMMSEGRLSISSTRTDPKTGEHTSDNREIEGPAQFAITEPVESLSEEISNRSVTLVLDMSLKQTERIMEYQRLLHSPEGVLLRKQKEIICDFYRHIQRELQPLEIINPYSKYLSFNARSHQARRDHQKYLTLLDSITLLFQHQREKVHKDFKFCVKTHPIDIEICNYLSRFIFAHSFEELPPQTLNFMGIVVKYIKEMAKAQSIDFDQVWFYRKETRAVTGLGNTRSHEHLDRMVDHEILTTRRDQNGMAYRFLYEPEIESGEVFIDRLKLVRMTEILKHSTKKERQEYIDYKDNLASVFKAFDSDYKGEVA